MQKPHDTFELSTEVLAHIDRLVQLDIDATFAYRQAIDGVDERDEQIRMQLDEFLRDHDHHIIELSEVLREHGREPPEYRRDAKGFLMEGMTAIRARAGTEGVLKAMRQNEMLTNKRYQEAVELGGLPPDVMEIIARGRADERRHLDFIEAMLAEYEATHLNAT